MTGPTVRPIPYVNLNAYINKHSSCYVHVVFRHTSNNIFQSFGFYVDNTAQIILCYNCIFWIFFAETSSTDRLTCASHRYFVPKLSIRSDLKRVPRAGGYRASGEVERALLCRMREAHVVHLGLVYYLADRQPTPVDYGLSTVHAAAVCRHETRGEFHSALRAWYLLEYDSGFP